jgi:hypothetical protein
MADIDGALMALRASGLPLTKDPSVDLWTHRVYWDGTHWVLVAHSKTNAAGQIAKSKPAVLDARAFAAAVKKLPAGSAVWFDAPIAKESTGALLKMPEGSPPSAAILTPERMEATYVLAGTVTGSGIEYAWYNRAELDSEVRAPGDIGAGCSPNSPFPIRTDWVPVADSVDKLTNSAVQLARLNGWLNIESTSLSGEQDFPYRLVLRRASEVQDVDDGGATYQGKYELDLIGPANAQITPRWVYVLGIDCQGRGSLLWPFDGSPAAKFPQDQGNLERIVLPGAPFDVGAPFGTDTYLLLTTSSPLSDPYALEFNGVVTRSAKGPQKPKDSLEELLDSISLGTRGGSRTAPTNWSVQALRVQSRAQPAASATGKPPELW